MVVGVAVETLNFLSENFLFATINVIITTKMVEFHLLKWNITSSKNDCKVIMPCNIGWFTTTNLCKKCFNFAFFYQKLFFMMISFVCLFVSFMCVGVRERDGKFRQRTHFHSFGFDLHIRCVEMHFCFFVFFVFVHFIIIKILFQLK